MTMKSLPLVMAFTAQIGFSAHAGLLIHEPFDHLPGDLTGGTGGTGGSGLTLETRFIPVIKTADPRFLRLHLDTP